MRKLLFCFVLVVNSASATAIISTQAICDGFEVDGSTSAECGNLMPLGARASAGSTGVLASAFAFVGTEVGHSASALASFQDDLVFTVTAGLVPKGGAFLGYVSS